MKIDFTYNELIQICFLFVVVDKEYVKQGKHMQHVLLGKFRDEIYKNINLKKYELDLSKHYIIELSNIIMDACNVSGSKYMYNLCEQGINIYGKLNRVISEIVKAHGI